MKKGTAVLREKNRREVLKILRKNKGCSRKDIVDMTNVSKNTISLIIESLIQEGIVEEEGIQITNNVGRPQVSLRIISGSMKLLAVSLEENRILAVIMDYELNEMKRAEVAYSGQEECITKLTRLIGDMAASHSIFGVVVSVPGIVDSSRGIVKLSLRLNLKDYNLKSSIESVFSGRILIINSVKALALLYFDKEREPNDSLFYIRMRTGIGGALIHKNALLNGYNWTAGEIGQLEIENSFTARCTLEELIRNIIDQLSPEDVTSYNELLRQLAAGLSQAVSTAIYLYDPEKIVFDCPFNSNEFFKAELIKQVKDNRFVSKYYNENLIFAQEPLSIEQGAAFALIHEYEMMEEE